MSEYTANTVHDCKEKPEKVSIYNGKIIVKSVELKIEYCPFCGKKL